MAMWDKRYAGEAYFYGTEPNDYLKQQADLFAEGARVLCLAEGEGRNAVYLAQRGMKVTAVDASTMGLAKAEKLARSRGVDITTQVADLTDYSLEHEAWDAIVSIFCHLPSNARIRLHRQIFQALKPGGLFVLEAYRPEQLDYGTGGPPDPDWLMTEAELRAELGDLYLEEIQSIERSILEGQAHTGMSAVVQVLGLKV